MNTKLLKTSIGLTIVMLLIERLRVYAHVRVT